MGKFDKQFKKILKRIENATKALNKGGPHVEEMAEWAVDKIRVRTRLGFGTDKHKGGKDKLAPLKASTIKARKKKRLSGFTRAGMSNLTETGNMLADITYRIRKSKIVFSFKDAFSKKKAKWAKDGSSNRAKRPFLNLTAQEYKQAQKILKLKIQKLLKTKLRLSK